MAEALRPLSHTRAAGLSPTREWLRYVPAVTLALFLAPIGAGLIGTWLPAFGYLPSLGGDTLSLAPWRALLAHPSLPGAITLTLVSGGLATVLSVALAVGCVAACHGTRTFARMRQALAPLLAVPHVALAIGFAFLIAPSGWVARALSPWLTGWALPPDVATVQDRFGLALAAALVIKETPFLLLMILAAVEQAQPAERLATARSLGYGPVFAWLKGVFPAIYPQIRLPIYAVLAFSFSVVDMALILAPATPPPLAVLVFRWFNDPDLAMRFPAAAGATLQFVLVAAAIGLWRLGEYAAIGVGRRWIVAGTRGGDGRIARAGATGALLLVYGAAAAGIAALALWSLARRWRYPDALPSEWTLETWLRHGDGLQWTGLTTLVLGVAAAGVALVLVLGCLENETRRSLTLSNRALWLLYTPLLVPQVAFLFGAQVLAVEADIDGTWVALIWSHLLFVLPYVFLALADPYRALDDRYVRTALCLGAGRTRIFWRIKVPMLMRPILVAVAIGFAISVAQYLPTLFAGAGRFMTLTTEAVALSAGGNRRVVGIYAFLQAVLPLIAFIAALAVPGRRGAPDGRRGAGS